MIVLREQLRAQGRLADCFSSNITLWRFFVRKHIFKLMELARTWKLAYFERTNGTMCRNVAGVTTAAECVQCAEFSRQPLIQDWP